MTQLRVRCPCCDSIFSLEIDVTLIKSAPTIVLDKVHLKED
jgi:hypothetical protein